ncbi:RNB-like protein [Dictyocaulus viviparus]|uniref:RNB-like protein n=1 Tax=Dictyocaulus viviparus TaxID=29172 RepID=A0A0D8X806_DICVI|nr:RNB-like protein [Dictyocaulus viviparus]
MERSVIQSAATAPVSPDGEDGNKYINHGQYIEDAVFETHENARIVTDTGRFLHTSTSPSTLLIASKLLETGFNCSEVHNAIYLRSLKEHKLMSYVINRIKITPYGCAYAILPKNIHRRFNIHGAPLSMIHALNNIQGVQWDPRGTCFFVGPGFGNLQEVEKSWFCEDLTNYHELFCALSNMIVKQDQISLSQEAAIIEISEHTKTKFVGTLLVDRNKPLGYELGDLNGLRDGDKIYVEIDQFFPTYVKAKVLKMIGNYHDHSAEVESFLIENGVALTFLNTVIEESEKIYADCLEDQDSSQNWPKINLPFTTIDPKTAMDYDDAIYVKKNPDSSYRLAVAIAAVSDYINVLRNGDAQFTYETGLFRCYHLVYRIIFAHQTKMQPKKSTLRTCKLMIKAVWLRTIQNYRRCTYREINDSINQDFKIRWNILDATIAELVRDAFELSSVLELNNSKRGLISFDLPEVKPYYDAALDEVKVVIKIQGTAEKMIENFMVATNEADPRQGAL